jgi:anti-sigma factor RsiW
VSDCEWTEPRLGAWVDGELAPDQARRVMTHVERCAACERRRLLLRETSALLRGLGSAMLAAEPKPVAVRRGRRLAWLAAAALFALGVGFAWAHQTRVRPALANDCAHCGPEPFVAPQNSGNLAKTP